MSRMRGPGRAAAPGARGRLGSAPGPRMRQAGQPRWPGRAQVRAAPTPRAPWAPPLSRGRWAARGARSCQRARGGSGWGGAGGSSSVRAGEVRRGLPEGGRSGEVRRGERCPDTGVRRGQVSSVPPSPVRSPHTESSTEHRGPRQRHPRAAVAVSFAWRPVWFPGYCSCCCLRHGPHCRPRPGAAPVGSAVPGTGLCCRTCGAGRAECSAGLVSRCAGVP